MKGSNEVPPQRGLRPCALRQRVPRPRLTTAVLIVAVFATFASTTPRAEAGPDDLVVGGSLYVGDHFVFVVDRSATALEAGHAGMVWSRQVHVALRIVQRDRRELWRRRSVARDCVLIPLRERPDRLHPHRRLQL